MLRYIQKGTFIPDTPTDLANIGAYGEHITDLPTLIQSYINQGLITVQSSNAGWNLTGNTGTDAINDFIGTTDNMNLIIATNGVPRMEFLPQSAEVILKNDLNNISAFRVQGDISATISTESNTSQNSNSYWGYKVLDESDKSFTLGTTGITFGSNIVGDVLYDDINYIYSDKRNLTLESSDDPNGSPAKISFIINRNPILDMAFGITVNSIPALTPPTPLSNIQINQMSDSSEYGLKLLYINHPDKDWSIGVNHILDLGLSFQNNPIGSFDASSGTYSSLSDIKFKDNIVHIEDEDKLLELKPVQFTFKSDDKRKKRYGLIAQEVKKVIPEIVIGNEDTDNLTVDYTSLIPLLIKQIQVLTERVNALMK